jgi:hypothetical protein
MEAELTRRWRLLAVPGPRQLGAVEVERARRWPAAVLLSATLPLVGMAAGAMEIGLAARTRWTEWARLVLARLVLAWRGPHGRGQKYLFRRLRDYASSSW